jgi:signal transduction histidine kinase
MRPLRAWFARVELVSLLEETISPTQQAYIMDAENLRKFKHELRTPVNHILGYSDLLLESADDSGDNSIAELARNIHASGELLAKLLERGLLSPSGDMDEVQTALRDSTRPIVRQILEILPPHSMLNVDAYGDDLERIRLAASQLLALLGADAVTASNSCGCERQ